MIKPRHRLSTDLAVCVKSHSSNSSPAAMHTFSSSHGFRPARGHSGERKAGVLTHGHCTKGMPKICAARHPPHKCHLALETEPCQLRPSFLLTQHCVILQKTAVCSAGSTIGRSELRCGESQSNELFRGLTAMPGLQHHGTLNSIRSSRMLNFFA